MRYLTVFPVAILASSQLALALPGSEQTTHDLQASTTTHDLKPTSTADASHNDPLGKHDDKAEKKEDMDEILTVKNAKGKELKCVRIHHKKGDKEGDKKGDKEGDKKGDKKGEGEKDEHKDSKDPKDNKEEAKAGQSEDKKGEPKDGKKDINNKDDAEKSDGKPGKEGKHGQLYRCYPAEGDEWKKDDHEEDTKDDHKEDSKDQHKDEPKDKATATTKTSPLPKGTDMASKVARRNAELLEMIKARGMLDESAY